MNKLPVIIIILTLLGMAPPSHAYIDPGSGSLILQGIIAGIAMGLYTIKLYWYKLTGFFRRKDVKDKKKVEQEDD